MFSDWGDLNNWLNVLVLSALVYVAALIGGFLAFRRRWLGALVIALLFAVFYYVVWTYFPHWLVSPPAPKAS